MAQTDFRGVLSWHKLCGEIRRLFSSNEVDVDEVQKVMSAYTSDTRDWDQYVNFDQHRYTRNLVDEGNGRYNLIVLCWGESQGSCVHDHANSHCFMKVLGGVLKETQFEWPEVERSDAPLQEKNSTNHHVNDVTYINDSIGLHSVENPSHTDPAVSLHLYSPPITCCSRFDHRTGKSQSCNVTFYSRMGQRCSC